MRGDLFFHQVSKKLQQLRQDMQCLSQGMRGLEQGIKALTATPQLVPVRPKRLADIIQFKRPA
jgi:conjugal transfer/entry exclusion protein